MKNIYDKNYINIFGLDFLLKNKNILTDDLLKEGLNNVEKFKYILSSKILRKNLSYDEIVFVIYKKLNIDIIKRIENELDNNFCVKKINDDISKIDFIKVIINDNSYDVYKLICSATDSYYVLTDFNNYLPYFNDSLFVNFCRKYFVESKKNINIFCSFFNEHRDFLSSLDINNNSINKCINLWVKNDNIDIKCIDDLLNIVSLRKEYLIKKIKKDINQFDNRLIIQTITLTLFDMYIHEFETTLNDLVNMKLYLPDNIIDKLNKISSLLSISKLDDFIEYIELYSDDDFFTQANHCARNVAYKNIVSHLYIKGGNETIILNGEPFSTFVHKLTGYSDEKTRQYIKRNVSNWDNKYDDVSLVSVSLINQYNLATIPGHQSILLFDDIDYRRIVDMGVCDLYSESLKYYYGIKNNKSRIMLYKNFLNNCTLGYNEFVLKRYLNGDNLLPNGVLCMNHIKNYDQELADYFHVPLYVLKTNKYINEMLNHLEMLILNNKIDEFNIYAHQFIYSFIDNRSLIKKNFGDDYIYNFLDELIRYYSLIKNDENMNQLKNNLFKIINVFISLSSIKVKNGISCTFLSNVEKYKNKVKKM